jgi:hypothetical protein
LTQGSTLGPLSSNIFINGLFSKIRYFSYLLFADDSKYFALYSVSKFVNIRNLILIRFQSGLLQII